MVTKKKKEEKEYIIKSVDNALDLLEAFIGREEELGVGELSRRLKLSKNNVFRLLSTFTERGYIEQNEKNEMNFL